MEFRDLKTQYKLIKPQVDRAIANVLESTSFISGKNVSSIEEELARFTGRKYCISCANGTDALEIALRALEVGAGDAVFVPDFTFFSTGEVVSTVGAMPVFIDVSMHTYNISCDSLETAIKNVIRESKYTPKAIIAVDLFGQPAEYEEITKIAKKYNLYVVEDGAQGFGGNINGKIAGSFGDISTTSFFPAKPLGCYGDGGAIFTDNEKWMEIIKSICVHGKAGNDKYNNVRIGMNSRLDSIQAAVLLEKFKLFKESELEIIDELAQKYSKMLRDYVIVPTIINGYKSSWAQYTIQLKSNEERQYVIDELKKKSIPAMIYYAKGLHEQKAFTDNCIFYNVDNTRMLSQTVLSLPFSPYILNTDIELVANTIIDAVENFRNEL